jgi:hypothetical protein
MKSKEGFTESSEHKIFLIDNSHLTDCAANLKLLPNDQFEVSGTTKPGVDSKTTLEHGTSEVETL